MKNERHIEDRILFLKKYIHNPYQLLVDKPEYKDKIKKFFEGLGWNTNWTTADYISSSIGIEKYQNWLISMLFDDLLQN